MHGDELLDTLRREMRGRPVAAMLRHAARHPIADPARPELAEITAEGAAAAERFGARLEGCGAVRLFHSPVKRCQQTVECIARGAARAGLAVEVVGPQTELGLDYIRDLPEAGRLSELHGHHFVRLWFGGEVPPAVIQSAKEIAAAKLRYLADRLREPAPAGGRLDLHVSHDWNIIVLRELCLGVRHEEAGWLTFLDGVTFAAEDAGLRAGYRTHGRVLEA